MPLVHRVHALRLPALLVRRLLEEQRDQRRVVVLREPVQQRVLVRVRVRLRLRVSPTLCVLVRVRVGLADLVGVGVVQAKRGVLGEELPHSIRLSRSRRCEDCLQTRLPLSILLHGRRWRWWRLLRAG